jgi:hypothetical protein
MPLYRVVWEIDVEAGDPLAAATEAQAIQKDPDSTACVFDVTDQNTKLACRVDLLPNNGLKWEVDTLEPGP